MRYASVRAPVLGWLSCLVLALCTAACTGRSSLNDFANGSTDTVKGRPGAGNGGNANAGDGDGGNANGANGDGGSDDDGGGSGGSGGSSGGSSSDGRGIGEACTDAEQCAGRSATCLEQLNVFNFLMIDFPGGYCTQADCSQDSDCPMGSRCFSSIPNQSFCAKTCTADTQCRTREGYGCDTAPLSQEQQTYCLPPINIPGGGAGTGGTRGG